MKKFLATAALVAFSTTPVLADNTATDEMTVNGVVVAALAITAVTDMTLPTVVKPLLSTDDDNTVTLACTTLTGAAAASFSTGASPGATNPTGTEATGVCGAVTTVGEAGYTFGVTTGNVLGFTGATFAPDCEATGTVATDFYCGGELTVTEATTAGAITGTFDVTVTYN